MAILEVFTIFVSSKWCSFGGLIMESDNSNSVNWNNNADSMPWHLKRYSYLLDSLKVALSNWKVVHVWREGNSVADGLAKAGVSRMFSLLFFLK
ncbi:hypothetical protein REPUB_Repub19eG0109500 [Reevesia pubescens]